MLRPWIHPQHHKNKKQNKTGQATCVRYIQYKRISCLFPFFFFGMILEAELRASELTRQALLSLEPDPQQI
jgi:hypothetical protein